VHRSISERIVVAIVLLVATVHVSPLVFEHIDASSSNDDWTQIFAFQAFLADELSTNGALPERSHILGGGFPIVGHPEYPVISPVSLPVFALGPVLGVRFAAAAYLLIGVFGMWGWLRSKQIEPVVAAYGSLVYATSGWFIAIMVSGNFPQIYYLWLPLWLWWVVPTSETAKRLDGRLVGAAILGAIALTDGHLNTVCTLLVVGFFGVTTSRRATERVLVFLGLVATLGAFKLAPTLSLLAIEDRSIDLYTSEVIETAIFSGDLFWAYTGRPDGFPLGWLPWVIGLLGLARIRQRDVLRLISVFVLASLLWLGPNSPIDLFWVLSRLPILGSIDAPSKYFVFFIGFATIALGCHGLMALPARIRAPSAIIASVVSAGLLMWHGSPELTRPFDRLDKTNAAPVFVPYEPLDTDYFTASTFTGTTTQRPDLYYMYRQGVPLVRWEDNFQLPTKIIPAAELTQTGKRIPNPNAKPLATLDGESLSVEHFSANRIVVRLPKSRESHEITINQNPDHGWSCDGATPVTGRALLTLAAENTAIRVDCRFRSAPVRLGAGITGLTILVLLGYLWRRRSRTP
jgi:hypothetical protein